MVDYSAKRIRGTETEAALLAVEAAGCTAPLSTLVEVCDGDEYVAQEVAGELRRSGLAQEDTSLGGEVRLTLSGRRLARQIRESRESGEDRWDAVVRAFAAAISETRDHDSVTEVDGRPVTDDERSVALSRLERWECIKASHAMGRRFIRAFPLDRIHEIPGVRGYLKDHFERDSTSVMDHSTNNTTNVSGGTNSGFQTGGSGNQQQITMTLNHDERQQIAAKVGEIRAQLGDGPDADELRAAVDRVEEEAESDTSTRASLRQRVTEAALLATGTSVGSNVLPLITQMLGITN